MDLVELVLCRNYDSFHVKLSREKWSVLDRCLTLLLVIAEPDFGCSVWDMSGLLKVEEGREAS